MSLTSSLQISASYQQLPPRSTRHIKSSIKNPNRPHILGISLSIPLLMGITHSTARWAAPLSFLVDFAAQQYGMLASPNMKDVHDANISFWSPQPYFIAAFFFPQQIFQLVWLYRLYKLDPKKSEKEKKEVDTMLDFVPFYIVGNLCIASKL